MASACAAHNVKLLCYGTLLGGFLSSLWLGQREPSVGDDASRYMTASLRKYLKWIQIWGGWALFQELLVVLNTIAQKHHVSLSNVAQRWVLEQASVGGIVVGARLGHREHVTDNSKVFTFRLDEEDRQAIQAVQGRKRNDLMSVYGDCGGEYRPKTY
ncbi:NADP-dependent oxidoreductase domain-containing protein [Ochromonadaceae sp. CCMP2298]|nr:NADP-dependent oxidoreductase domain-containing protein [Ochromonadaceae sp. CCMP2298]